MPQNRPRLSRRESVVAVTVTVILLAAIVVAYTGVDVPGISGFTRMLRGF